MNNHPGHPIGEGGVLFSPGIYEHAAAVIGETPRAVSRDAPLLHRAQLASWQRYGHPMVVAGIDVYNVEPEAMGAGVDEPADNGVPSIISHPAETVAQILGMPAPDPTLAGRMPMVLDVARRLVDECQPSTVFVPVCGPLALGNGLAGMDEMLCTMMEDPATVREALAHLAESQKNYIRAILAVGARPLVFESGASPPLLPPALFFEAEAPALGRLFAICRESGDHEPACILGGNVLPVLRELMSRRPGFLICPSETDQPGFVEEAASHPEIAVRINMPVASLLEPDWKRTAAAADRAVALAKRLPRGSVGTGVVPYDTPPEVLIRLLNHIQRTS